jgi:hypothetical protein
MAENEATPGPTELKNELEFLIDCGREGKVTMATIYQALIRSSIIVLMNKEWDGRTQDPELKAMMLQDKDGNNLMVTFTDESRTAEIKARHPEFTHEKVVPVAPMLDNLDEQIGLIINPGQSVGVQITPEGLKELKEQFGYGWLPSMKPDPIAPSEDRIGSVVTMSGVVGDNKDDGGEKA